MKKQYEKPLSTAVELMTEGVIAASDIMAIMSTEDLNMEVQDASVWGAWE